ncbi:hypothetical protein MCEMSHM24_02478 [Comamonadaceae bacterium]
MFKKLVMSAVAIACSSLAHADSFVYQAWAVEGSAVISTSDLILQLPASKIDSSTSGESTLLAETGKELGDSILAVYRRAGYVAASVLVDVGARTIHIREGVALPTGPFAKYLPAGKVISATDFELAGLRSASELTFNRQRVSFDIQPTDFTSSNSETEIRTSLTDDEASKQVGGSFGYSSLGQRYSGSDVLTASAYANLKTGFQAEASAAVALADTTDESRGGGFGQGHLILRRAGVEGLTSVQASLTDYAVGGAMAPLKIKGSVERLGAEHSYIVSKDLSVAGRITSSQAKQRFDALGWDDTQSYTSIGASARYQVSPVTQIEVGIEQGINGTHSFNQVALQGRFDPNYTVATASASTQIPVAGGWVAVVRGGAQTSSKGTPAASQLALGGDGRASSYSSGYVSVLDGAHLSATLNSPVLGDGFQFYTGVDGSTGQPSSGKVRSANSALVGVRYVKGSLSVNLGYAASIDNHDEAGTSGEKAFLQMTWSF